jgi:hypothetical protein
MLLEYFIYVISATDDIRFVIIFDPTYSAPLSFSGLTNSCLEVAEGNGVITVSGGTEVLNGFVGSGTNSFGSQGQSSEVATNLLLGSKIDGTQQTVVLCVESISASSDVRGSLSWSET